MITTPAPMPISASPALPPTESSAIESPKSQWYPIAMQAGISLPRSSRPKLHSRSVSRRPLPSPDPVSPPRSSVAVLSEVAESGTTSDSTILSPSPKLKSKPCKPRVFSKAPIFNPFRVSLPPHKKYRVHKSSSSSKSKDKVCTSSGQPLSQSKSFIFTSVSF